MSHDQPLEHDERPSRSQRRRDALATLALAEQLVGLPPARANQLDLPDDVREEAARVRATTAHGARKRELAYLAKLMRRHDGQAFNALRAALGADRERRRRDAAALQRVDVLRERLLDGDQDALTALIAHCPGVDRQHLHALIRQARIERERAKPPRAARELLRLLRDLDAADFS